MIFIRIHEKIANQCWRQHPAVHVHVAKTGKKMKAKVGITSRLPNEHTQAITISGKHFNRSTNEK